jgi:hypothetical protein
VVELNFFPYLRDVEVHHEVVDGLDPQAVVDWIYRAPSVPGTTAPVIYVEGYRSRGNLGHDKDMLIAVRDMVAATKGKALDNTGVKKTVKPAVLQALGVWKFSTPTHHDDLRSAARIAVLGMLKEHNELLADVIRDYIDGRPWRVIA